MKKTLFVVFAMIISALLAVGCSNTNNQPTLPEWTENAIQTTENNITTTAQESLEVETTIVETDLSADPTEIIEANPVSLYASIEDVKSWCRPEIVEEYHENIIDEFTKEWTADLKFGGTVTITESDGLYFQTAYRIAYADLDTMENQMTVFLQLWLGRNLTAEECTAVFTAIKNAEQADSSVMVDNIFPEQIMIYIVCAADYGCRMTF